MTPTTPTQPRRRDRRRDRHEATKREILDTAWSMVRADGLAALSLRALAHAVDMEPQSLYTYFASKNALYDHMFADGNQELARRFAAAEIPAELRAALRAVARLLVEFAAHSQQLANDPGGDRYIRLIDDAVTMFADHVLGASRPHRAPIPEAPPAPAS